MFKKRKLREKQSTKRTVVEENDSDGSENVNELEFAKQQRISRNKMKGNRMLSSKKGKSWSSHHETTTTNEYSAENLAQLKAEQNYKPQQPQLKPEEEDFIALDPSKTPRVRFKEQETFHEASPERDLEYEQWEEEQIRRGGHQTERSRGMEESVKVESIETIERRLDDRIIQLTESQTSYERSLVRLQGEFDQLEKEVGSWETELDDTSTEFASFQEIRDFVNDLCFCFREKIEFIEEVESAVFFAYERHWKAHRLRVRQFMDDDISDLRDSQVVLDLGEYKTIDEEDNSIQEPDFAGRSHVGYFRIQQRDARRKKRDARSEKVGGSTSMDTGLNSDYSGDEEDTLQERIEKLVKARDVIFQDVNPELCDLSQVVDRFKKWKHNFPQAYEKAYCDHSLQKLLVPFARYEVCLWDPFKHSKTDRLAHHLKWIRIVDQLIVPSILTAVVVPNIAKRIECSFNPFSAHHSAVLQRIVVELKEEYACSIEPIANALEQTFQHVLTHFCLPLVDSKDQKAYKWAQTQYWRSIRLLTNLVSWMEASTCLLSTIVTLVKRQIAFLSHSFPFESEDWINMIEAFSYQVCILSELIVSDELFREIATFASNVVNRFEVDEKSRLKDTVRCFQTVMVKYPSSKIELALRALMI